MRKLTDILVDVEQSIMILEKARNEIPRRIEELEGLLAVCDAESQDLLHYMEAVDVNAYEGFLRYKELQEVRQKRRQAKIELEDLRFLHTRLEKRLFNSNRLDSTISNFEHRKQTHTNPTYTTKVRTDLQERLNKSLSKKKLHIQ